MWKIKLQIYFLVTIWWHLSDKRNNIVTDYFVLKILTFAFWSSFEPNRKNAGTPSIWKCTWVLQIWCIIYVVMLLACHEICFLISDVVPLPRQIYNEQWEATSVWVSATQWLKCTLITWPSKKRIQFCNYFLPQKNVAIIFIMILLQNLHTTPLWSHQMWLMRMEPLQRWYQNQVTPRVGAAISQRI